MRTEHFETPGATTLQVSLYAADLTVSTWEQDATEVDVEARGDAQELLDEFTIELHPRGNGYEVVVREPKKGRLGFRVRDPHLSVRIRCPHGTALNASAGSSDVRCDGVLGPTELKTASGDAAFDGSVASVRVVSASGDVRAGTVLGTVSITTASGDVRLERVEGELGVNTVSGDIEVGAALAEAKAQSVSGDVELVALGGGDIRVQTVSGDVSVALGQGVAVWIDASSVSGDVGSSLEVGDAPTNESGRVVELRVKTVSGDVEITRASHAAA